MDRLAIIKALTATPFAMTEAALDELVLLINASSLASNSVITEQPQDHVSKRVQG